VIELIRDYTLWSSSNTTFAAYTGDSIDALTVIDWNTFDWPSVRYAAFSATAGTSYQFRVAGGWGGPFSLKLLATNPPVFLKQPTDCVVSALGSAFFTALAAGPRGGTLFNRAMNYQWLSNGIPIPDETGASLLVHEATTNKIANYSVIASNAGGITVSAAATFSIIDTNPTPEISAVKSSNLGQAAFTLTGEVGRWYQVESTQNWSNWPSWYPYQNMLWMKQTNQTVLLSLPRLVPVHYTRACLNVRADFCSGQLKQLSWGQQLAAIDNNKPASGFVSLSDIQLYIPLVPFLNSLRPCPEFGYYAPGASITSPVTCTEFAHGHVIDTP
jgi:hypothetical protein